MDIKDVAEAIRIQAALDKFYAGIGLSNPVGGYAEALARRAIGGCQMKKTTKGFDLFHREYRRVEVKARQHKRRSDGTIKREDRAVGFGGKENGFDYLLHIVLSPDYEVIGATLVQYADVWPEIQRAGGKVSYRTSASLASSIDVTVKLLAAQRALGLPAQAVLRLTTDELLGENG